MRRTTLPEQHSTTTVVSTTTRERKTDHQRKRQPRYHVILWNDDDHTYQYVIQMMRRLFGHSAGQGFQIASVVDTRGRAICLTTTREHAELKLRLMKACFDASVFTMDPSPPRLGSF